MSSSNIVTLPAALTGRLCIRKKIHFLSGTSAHDHFRLFFLPGGIAAQFFVLTWRGARILSLTDDLFWKWPWFFFPLSLSLCWRVSSRDCCLFTCEVNLILWLCEILVFYSATLLAFLVELLKSSVVMQEQMLGGKGFLVIGYLLQKVWENVHNNIQNKLHHPILAWENWKVF